MSLRIIYGRTGSGKSTKCLEEIANSSRGTSNSLIYIVPEQYSLQAEKNLIKSLGEKGLIGIEVLSFKRLANRILNKYGIQNGKAIDKCGKSMLLFKVIYNLGDKLEYFKKCSDKKGFPSVVSNIIAEFKRYGIEQHMAKEIISKVNKESLLYYKLRDISLIYSEYEKLTGDKFIDADDSLNMLLECLENNDILNDAQIWIDEFTGFTPQEYLVIEKLITKSEQINIALCTDCLELEGGSNPEDNIFHPVRKTYKKLKEIAYRNNINIETPLFMKEIRRYKELSLKHLEENLFKYPSNKYEGETKGIELCLHRNIFSEVEETARQIVSLVRDNKLRYKDISIVTGAIDTYEGVVNSIFALYNIPVFIDSNKSMSDYPIASLILSFIEIINTNYSYRAMFNYLKTGLSNLEIEEVDLLENYVLEWNIKGLKTWTCEEEWTFGQKIDDDKDNEYYIKLNEIRRSVALIIDKYHQKFKGKHTIQEMSTYLYEFMYELEIPSKVAEEEKRLLEENNLEQAGIWDKTLKIINEILQQAVETAGDILVDFKFFSGMIQTGIGIHKIGLIPPSLDQVVVGSVQRTRTNNVKALFILGTNDGQFPSPPPTQGVFSDRDRNELLKLGLSMAGDTKSATFEKQIDTYQTICAPSEFLYIYCPTADLEGKALRPSFVLQRIKNIYGDDIETSKVLDTYLSLEDIISNPLPTLGSIALEVRKQGHLGAISPLLAAIAKWFKNRNEYIEEWIMINKGLEYKNISKQLDEKTAKLLYGSPINVSISKIEKYTKCPYSFYLDYGLKVKERKEFILTPIDIGIFLHSGLELLAYEIEKTPENWENIDKDSCYSIAQKKGEEILEKYTDSIFKSSTANKHLSNRFIKMLQISAWAVVKQIKAGGFRPEKYEASFARDGDYAPLKVSDKVSVEGKIDRIDSCLVEGKKYYRVIDYKSGNKALKYFDIWHGLNIQLPLYMEALMQNLSENDLPAGLLYFKVDEPIVKASPNESKENIEEQLTKEMKMKGLVLKEKEVILAMDNNAMGNSLYIPTNLTKSGEPSKSSTATDDELRLLGKHACKIVADNGEQILEGHTDIHPYMNKKQRPCSFCPYMSVCMFEASVPGSGYRVLGDIDKNEIIKRIKEENE